MVIFIAYNKFVQKGLLLAVELKTFLRLTPCKNWLWYKNYNAYQESLFLIHRCIVAKFKPIKKSDANLSQGWHGYLFLYILHKFNEFFSYLIFLKD